MNNYYNKDTDKYSDYKGIIWVMNVKTLAEVADGKNKIPVLLDESIPNGVVLMKKIHITDI